MFVLGFATLDAGASRCAAPTSRNMTAALPIAEQPGCMAEQLTQSTTRQAPARGQAQGNIEP